MYNEPRFNPPESPSLNSPPLPIMTSPAVPPGSVRRGTATGTIVSVDNAAAPRWATISVKNKTPFEGGYIVPPGCGPFAAGGTSGYHFFYNNSSGIGGSIVRIDLDSKEITGFTGDVSTSAPVPFYKAVTDHVHSGNLNPDGFLNPNPVDLSANQTQNLLPYGQNSTGIQAVININGKLLATQFSGGLQNLDGSFSFPSGSSASAMTFATVNSQIITVKCLISKGALVTNSGVILGDFNNGYGILFETGVVYLIQFKASAQSALASYAYADDTNYHTFVISVKFGTVSNTIEGYFDSHNFGIATDAAPPTLSNPASVLVNTGSTTGKLQDFEVYLGGDPYQTLPAQVTGMIDANGKLLATMFPGAVQNADNSVTLAGGGPTTTVTTFTTAAGTIINAKGIIAAGVGGSPAAQMIIGNLTNGYGISFDSSNQFYLFRQKAGVGTTLGSISGKTFDSLYHTFKLTLTINSSTTTVDGLFDSTPLPTYIDASPATLANPSGITINTPGTTSFGRIQDLSIEMGSIQITQLPTVPGGSIPVIGAYSGVSLASYVTGASSYGATLGFTTTITPDPSTWIDHAEIRAVPTTYAWNSNTCAGITVATITRSTMKGASTPYSVVCQNMPAGQAYDLRLVLFDHQGLYFDGGGAIITTTSAQYVANTTMLGMPSAILSAGPTVTGSLISRSTNAGTVQSALTTFTETDFTTTPAWFNGAVLVVRINGDTNGARNTLVFARDISGTGVATMPIPLSVGETIDIGLFYRDMTGNSSATTWYATANADAFGGFIDPADPNRGLTHPRVSQPVRKNINANNSTNATDFNLTVEADPTSAQAGLWICSTANTYAWSKSGTYLSTNLGPEVFELSFYGTTGNAGISINSTGQTGSGPPTAGYLAYVDFTGYIRIYKMVSGTWTQVASVASSDASNVNSGYIHHLKVTCQIVPTGTQVWMQFDRATLSWIDTSATQVGTGTFGLFGSGTLYVHDWVAKQSAADAATFQSSVNVDPNGSGTYVAGVDFTKTHIGKTQDNVPDGLNYVNLPLVNVSGSLLSKRALIDLSQSHVNKTLDYIANTASGQLRAKNLVVNGDNANGTGSPAPNLFGWTGSLNGGTAVAAGTYSLSGRNYTVIRAATTANNGPYQTIRVVPGATYTFMALAYCDNATTGAATCWIGDTAFAVSQYNIAPGLPIGTGTIPPFYASAAGSLQSASASLKNQWQLLYGTFTIPASNANGLAAVLLYNTGAAGNAFFFGVQVYQGNRLQDFVPNENETAANLIDFSNAAHISKTLDYIGEGATYGRTNLAYLYTDGSGRRAPLIDFGAGGHVNKTLDYMPDGTTYVSLPAVNVSGTGTGKRALIDLQGAHANLLPLAKHDQTLQNRNGLTITSRGKPPFVDSSNVLHFPSLTLAMRPDGTYSYVAAGTTVSLTLGSAVGRIFIPWAPGASATPFFVAYTTSGAAGTGYAATNASPSYEAFCGIDNNGTSIFVVPYFTDSNKASAVYDVLGDDGSGNGNFHAGLARTGTTLPRANTHGDFTSTIKSGGGINGSAQISANGGVYNSVAYEIQMVLHVVVGAGPNYAASFYIDNGTAATAPQYWLPSSPGTTNTTVTYGSSGSPIALGSPFTTTTAIETLYFAASYSPGSTAGNVYTYAATSADSLQSTTATGNGWSIWAKKNYDFGPATKAVIYADGLATFFSSTGGGGTMPGGSGGGGSKTGGSRYL